MAKVNEGPVFGRLRSGDFSIAHYKFMLRETYFNARENPQLQAFATAFFKGPQRKVIRQFYQHAISEIGHDQLALNDLEALGEPTNTLPELRPLPATVAFTAYGFYQIQFLNPLGYLGYLFHLEFMPTMNGPLYMQQLAGLGVPEKAMSFLAEHATVDLAHNKLMERYLSDLIRSTSDLEEVIWAAKTSCAIHGRMLANAFEAAERGVSISSPVFSETARASL